MDFDPAAFGLPSGFGAQPKSKPKVDLSSTKRAEEANKSNGSGSGSQSSQAILDTAKADTASSSHDQFAREEPEAGPSDLSRKPRLDDEDRRDHNGEDEDEDEEENEDQEDGGASEDPTKYYPMSHEIVLKDHTKAVTALAVDPPGARVITGGYDYDVKMWDFGGMRGDFKPFKSFEPYENYHIHDLVWDNNGSAFVAIAGTLQAKLYDRDGAPMAEFAKGDMYLRDLKNTVGHVGQLTSASWDPRDNNKFATSSMDSTLRIWDVNDRFKSLKTIVLKSKERGGRTKITQCTYSPDGKTIAATAIDGTINLWSTSSNFARPNSIAENAHTKGTETSGITYSLDGRTIVTRGGDDTVKVWDARAFKKPVSVASNLTSLNPETNVIFSPDEKHILTGTAVDTKGKPGGRIVVMERDTLQIVKEYSVSTGSVIRLAWPSRINQILASTSLGEVHVFYSPELSEKGATLAAAKAPKQRRTVDDYVAGQEMGPIITPHALPMFKDQNIYEVSDAGTALHKRKRESQVEKNKALKARKPEPPVRGPGSGGRVGEAADRHVVMNMIRDDIRSEDPREALLKYAQAEPQWTKAWGKDQKTTFDYTPEPEESDDKTKK
ncbi:WD40 repeat-like protein [Cystobasidium minutum MCA 4210]|uniref:WD40 repeat-like protein n=1 Tax=Cystobasidium minutum MCA 4210 TaxID=1397322 RepID=UPI0034CEF2FC|eukprot:jgi/Rhomi1/156833/estExt_Genewise1Plus.C_1_t10497